ncbi:transcription elongation factor B polypeptide 3 [Leptinotarsa decemlineata]
MEHHNPYLIEDTDELWLLHSQKEFRTKKREELESWRDMYMRCLDEREARLSAITANIKQSQDKSIPIRTTKLAYVDSVVKPPRNVARQQARNGIFDNRPVSTTAKLSALAKSGEAGKISVPNPGSRAGERSSNAASLKPKKAPLMAKTLSFFKNRFKR